jgi:hypothetical protein
MGRFIASQFDQLSQSLKELEYALQNPVELISDICITEDFELSIDNLRLDDIIDVNIDAILSSKRAKIMR